jgi:hypothetical protein
MTDANRVRLCLVAEGSDSGTLGVTPANPQFQTLRMTRVDLAGRPRTVESAELRDDRMTSDLILVGQETGGVIAGELSFGSWDALLEAAVFGTWQDRPGRFNPAADQVITGVAQAGQTITVATGAAFVPGHLVRASGFAQAANNGLFRAGAGSGAGSLVVVGAALVDEAVPPAGARLRVVGIEGAAGDLQAATAPNRLTSALLDFTALGIAIGDWIKIGGAGATRRFTVAGCNGWARVGAVAAGALTLDVAPPGFEASVETTTTVTLWLGDRLVGGARRQSFTAELSHLGQATPTHLYHRGLVVDRLAIDLAPEAPVAVEFAFVGANSEDRDQRLPGATSLPPATTEVIDGAANVGRLGLGGAPLGGPNHVVGARLTVDNNLRRQEAVGVLGAAGIGVGQARIGGRLRTYFGSRDLLRKLLANEATGWDLALVDSNGRGLVLDLPRIKFTAGAPEVPGGDRDVLLDLDFVALADPALGRQIAIHRFHEGV